MGDLDRVLKGTTDRVRKGELGKVSGRLGGYTVDVGTGLLEVVGVYEKSTGWEGGYHLCAWGC